MKNTTRLVLLACLLPVLSWAQEEEKQAPASPVLVETAQRDTFSATLWVSGTVISQNDARIAAETDGRITWVANVGSRIEKGQPIARIDAGTVVCSGFRSLRPATTLPPHNWMRRNPNWI